MVCDNEDSMRSADGCCVCGPAPDTDANAAGTSATTTSGGDEIRSQARQSWKKMRRDDGDDLNSYLAGDLAVGVRSREADDHEHEHDHDADDRSIASSSTTSGGILQSSAAGGFGSSSAAAGHSSLPMTSIRQPTSGLSLRTHSSLSTSATADHNGNGSVTRQMSQALSEGDDGDGDGESATAAGAASAASMTPNNSVATPRSPHVAHTPVAGNNNAENTPPPTAAQQGTSTATQQTPASSSMVRSSSGAAGSLITAQSAGTIDSWGFFDDHDPTMDTPGNSTGDLRRKNSGQAATTPGGSSNSNGRGSSSASTPGGGGGGGSGSGSGPKRRGLLNFSDVMTQSLQGIPLLDPPKAESNRPDAVTAPTYVLEESMSSQNLWKHTAGNRPPQPAEERAFYEKIWAENFSNSEVAYEMPPEVLTSTTPTALSAFADGRDDGAGVSADYAVLGDESGATGGGGGGGATAGKTIGGIGGAPSVGPSRMLGATGAAQHYHLAKTGDSALGPHHPHHTMVNRTVHEKDGDLRIVCKGDNVFGTTVSKSFETVVGRGSKRRTESMSVSISVASYRVVECQKEKGKQYAQFLVIYCEGSFRDTVGVWRRYSDFKELSRRVMNGHGEGCATALQSMHPMSVTEEAETELMPNAITSWRLLKKRQRWFRCLDAGYLSLKVFLLERFLHDILFESSSPDILRDFVGVERK